MLRKGVAGAIVASSGMTLPCHSHSAPLSGGKGRYQKPPLVIPIKADTTSLIGNLFIPVTNKKLFFVYIITNKKLGVLYTGITSNLITRIYQHKTKQVEGFSKKYNLTKLVYFEEFKEPNSAITREKQIKKWNRSWKINLIEQNNPNWKDLYRHIIS